MGCLTFKAPTTLGCIISGGCCPMFPSLTSDHSTVTVDSASKLSTYSTFYSHASGGSFSFNPALGCWGADPIPIPSTGVSRVVPQVRTL
ncbi:hypothetical protein J6590_024168 [Homalodisca vitripennis]|nr:hypothetical protein J6590_024168 [Homalodisca vitripennis]